MQFRVPQFIDIEDKIFGPFTFKQFAYLAGGAGMIFVFYRLLPFWIAIFLIIPTGILSVALTFYKINGKPFMHYLQAGVAFLLRSKLYVWKQELRPQEEKKESVVVRHTTNVPTLTGSKLKDLSWSLDVLDTDK